MLIFQLMAGLWTSFLPLHHRGLPQVLEPLIRRGIDTKVSKAKHAKDGPRIKNHIRYKAEEGVLVFGETTPVRFIAAAHNSKMDIGPIIPRHSDSPIKGPAPCPGSCSPQLPDWPHFDAPAVPSAFLCTLWPIPSLACFCHAGNFLPPQNYHAVRCSYAAIELPSWRQGKPLHFQSRLAVSGVSWILGGGDVAILMSYNKTHT